MKYWNWKHKNWPNFTYDTEKLKPYELKFSQLIGTVLGVLKYTDKHYNESFLIDLMSDEALETSEIEGELLDRKSVQSSIKRNLGLTVSDNRKVPPAEFGISEMMVDLYKNFDKKLTHKQLFEWHKMLTNGRRDLNDIGKYRTHIEPMQIVSGSFNRPIVHFEAPLSGTVNDEMETFIQFFNQHHFENNTTISPLIKAGIAHFHFVTIHPFEDGNGRIGRAIIEKSLALSIGKPALLSISKVINSDKKSYYTCLENHNTTLDITDWLLYFAEITIKAQENTLSELDFIINKTRFFDKFTSELNERQLKVIQRIFEEGSNEFLGGLSAKNYKIIAKTSDSTTTRDLQELVKKEIFKKEGKLKSTRYFLNF